MSGNGTNGASSPKITHPKKRAMLAAIEETACIVKAAVIAEVPRRTHYQWHKDDPQYRAAVAVAVERGADVLEAEARRRALEGVEEPVGWYQGTAGGVVTKYSDTLLIFLLKAARPEKFRDNLRVEGDLSLSLASAMAAIREDRLVAGRS